jgi:hypothetical protein
MKMMNKKHIARLKRHYPLFKALQNATDEQRRLIIKKAGPDLIKTIADICFNLTSGKIKLPENKRKKLIRFRHPLRRLADRKVKIQTKRKEIIQKGGFLSAIIPAISIVASLVSGLLAK